MAPNEKKEKTLAEVKRLLQEVGYSVTKGFQVAFSPFDPSFCSNGQCDAGCQNGCSSCSPGNSSGSSENIHPTFVLPKGSILEDLVTVAEIAKPTDEKRENE